jgi:glycosyltransferase EpsD
MAANTVADAAVNTRVLLVMPSVTSYEVFFRGLRAAGAACGLDIRVAGGPAIEGCEGQGLPDDEVMDLPAFRSGSPAALAMAAWRLSRHVRRWRPAIVHSHFAAGAVCAAIARGLSGRCGANWVSTFHGLHGSGGRPSIAATFAEQIGVRGADVTFVLNREDVDYLAQRVSRADVRLVEGFGVGCDLVRYDARRFSPAEVEEIRRSYRVGPGPVLAFIGRKTSFKGYDIAVAAWRIVRKTNASAVLVVAGADDAIHGADDSAGHVEERDGRIELGWQRDVSRVLAIADVCVFPSVREGMPVNLMEALSMGVPCVTFDTRGCRDVVRSAVDGYVVPERTPEAIAHAVERVIGSAATHQAMRASALAGRRRFDREDYFRRQVEFYARGA